MGQPREKAVKPPELGSVWRRMDGGLDTVTSVAKTMQGRETVWTVEYDTRYSWTQRQGHGSSAAGTFVRTRERQTKH